MALFEFLLIFVVPFRFSFGPISKHNWHCKTGYHLVAVQLNSMNRFFGKNFLPMFFDKHLSSFSTFLPFRSKFSTEFQLNFNWNVLFKLLSWSPTLHHMVCHIARLVGHLSITSSAYVSIFRYEKTIFWFSFDLSNPIHPALSPKAFRQRATSHEIPVTLKRSATVAKTTCCFFNCKSIKI